MSKKNIKDEMKITILIIFTIFIVISINIFSLYQIDKLHVITEDIYNHPLKVSNVALNVQKGVIVMQKDMKDIILAISQKELTKLIKKVAKEEMKVYESLNIIKLHILGQEGLKYQQNTYKLFKEWKAIRDMVINLVRKKEIIKAMNITKGKGVIHVLKLEKSANILNKYAQNKANDFQKKANNIFSFYIYINLILTILVMMIFIIMIFYIRYRIKNYIKTLSKNEIELKELSEQLKLALSGTNDGLWDWNIKEETIYFSPRYKEMLGYTDDELRNDFSSWWHMIHKDDRDKVLADIKNNIKGNTNNVNNIHRIKHKDGHWIWIHNRAKAIFNENGQAICMIGTHADVTSEKILQIKSDERGKILDNSLNEIYIVDDEDHKFLYINREAESNTGYSFKEMREMVPLDITLGITEKVFSKILKRMIKGTQEYIPLSTQYRRKNGTLYDVDIYIQSTIFEGHNAYVLIVLDVTNRKKAEKAIVVKQKELDYQYRILNLVINGTPDLIFYKNYKNNDGKYMKCNIAFEKFVGKSHEQIVHHTDRELFGEEIGSFFRQKDKEVLKQNKTLINEEWVTYPDGHKVLMSTSKTPFLDRDSEVFGIIGISRDITDKYYADLTIKQLNDNLQKEISLQLEKIREQDSILVEQSKLAQMGNMVNMIAHQWRQPLNVISASAINLSLQNELGMLTDKSIEKTSQFIQKQVQNLSQIINDFMKFNQPEENQEFLLYNSVDAMRKIISAQLTDRTITLDIHVDKEIKVYHNSKNIEHILLNLIMNSRDAFEENEDIENKTIKIFTKVDTDSISLCVEDNAGGILKDTLDKVFNPYFTTKEQGKGTGIGLYMSKQMFEAIEGCHISVEIIDNSTIFTIKFKK